LKGKKQSPQVRFPMPTKQRTGRQTKYESDRIDNLLSAVEILNSSVQELLDAVESLISGATVHDYYAEAVPETLKLPDEDELDREFEELLAEEDGVDKDENIH
jgi:hypothetical protein